MQHNLDKKNKIEKKEKFEEWPYKGFGAQVSLGIVFIYLVIIISGTLIWFVTFTPYK